MSRPTALAQVRAVLPLGRYPHRLPPSRQEVQIVDAVMNLTAVDVLAQRGVQCRRCAAVADGFCMKRNTNMGFFSLPFLRRASPRSSPKRARGVIEEVTCEVTQEHTALVRWVGQLQQRMSAMQCANHDELTALHAELARLRAHNLVMRTAMLWGVPGAGALRAVDNTASRPPPARAPVAPEAHVVLCQTGCVGHAHAWLGEEGLCRRTGQACDGQAGAP